MDQFAFLGPFATPWGRILHHLDEWLLELQKVPCVQVPSQADPFKAIEWLLNLQHHNSEAVDDAAAKLAQFPNRRIPELTAEGLFLLRERIHLVYPVVQAMSTVWKQAREPVYLFDVQQYEGLEEQQVLWALVAYWHEHGRSRWTSDHFSNFSYAARLNGWRPETLNKDEKPKKKKGK